MKYKISNEKSKVRKLREHYKKKGIELINITKLCDYNLGESGWCNDINEVDETIHHIQVSYRGEPVRSIPSSPGDTGNGFVYYVEEDLVADDFIIFMKVKRVK